MKASKYSLLDKGEKEDKEDFAFGGEQAGSRSKEEAPYTLLKDQKGVKEKINPSVASKLDNKRPLPPPIVYNIPKVNNSVLNIGPYGVTIQPRTPYIPPVVVDCEKCQAKQQIPGNSHEFICCGCHEMSAIEPKFGLFICGVCRNHVSYPFKTSDHIQCNYCHTVNKVPIAPANKSKVRMEDKSESEPILPKDLREDIDIQDIQLADVTTARGEEKEQRQPL